MEDEDRSLLEGKPSQGSLELVAIIDREDLAGIGRTIDRENANLDEPTTAAPGLGVAGIGENPVEPRFEAIRIAERPKVPPGDDQCGLDSVLGQVSVTQDPTRDRHAPVADRTSEGIKSFAIARPRTIYEGSQHLNSRGLPPTSVRGHLVDDSRWRCGSI